MQSLEVAHHLAFGRGHLTWEWWPEHRLRGYIHPLPFAALFKLLAICGLDSTLAVVYAPRLLQACCAAGCDTAVYALARKQYGQRVANEALLCSLLAWFNFFCAIR